MSEAEFIAYWCANAGYSELPNWWVPRPCNCGGNEMGECHGWRMELDHGW
jgi:hypothetical protein